MDDENDSHLCAIWHKCESFSRLKLWSKNIGKLLILRWAKIRLWSN